MTERRALVHISKKCWCWKSGFSIDLLICFTIPRLYPGLPTADVSNPPPRPSCRCLYKWLNSLDPFIQTEVKSLLSPSVVNIINILCTAFAPVDPKSVKRCWQIDLILTLLGAMGGKAVRKYVDEVEPWPPLRGRVRYFNLNKNNTVG